MDTTDQEESSPRNQKKRTARDVACPGVDRYTLSCPGGWRGYPVSCPVVPSRQDQRLGGYLSPVNKHLWKHHLPASFGMRVVKIFLVKPQKVVFQKQVF